MSKLDLDIGVFAKSVIYKSLMQKG